MSATEAFIAHYGLLAVFAGGLLEGETILVVASVAAHHGILSLPAVFIVATVAAMLGDQAWFMAARFGSDRPMVRAMVDKPMVQKALDRVHRQPTAFVLSFRFIYGLRIAGAIACGLSRIPFARFLALNLVAAAVWAGVVIALGYAFGGAIEAVFGEVQRVEGKLIAAVAVTVVVFIAGRLYARRRR